MAGAHSLGRASAGRRLIMQLDFDGTVIVGDASTAILGRFAGEKWPSRVEAASLEVLREPDSPSLADTMRQGVPLLPVDLEPCLAFAREHFPARPGLASLVRACRLAGIEVRVVSFGFDFYVRDYLRAAGVEHEVVLHAGAVQHDGDGWRLAYTGPSGEPLRRRWKETWAHHFLDQDAEVIYVGDGRSDIAAARLAAVVFARDALLDGLRDGYEGVLRPFDTLEDVARGIEQLYGA